MNEPSEITDPSVTPKRRLPGWAKIGIVFTLLCTAVGFLLFGSDASDAFVYSKLVHEVVDTPAMFEGKQLRVEGDLRQGSVKFREQPCEWRFVLEKKDKIMAVRFPQCVVPDTFRDGQGLTVTVEGTLNKDGSFLASQVIPRCPSKYEMKQRSEKGEKMPYETPHAPTAEQY
ncbi:MAG: cytochrome c maturation protein CcmE [Myxococcales bacterium]|nr:MAG: cytochrome c maturation protein CcmE [Myxococcales bacterium]